MLCMDAWAVTMNHVYHDKYGVRVILGVENNPYTAHPHLPSLSQPVSQNEKNLQFFEFSCDFEGHQNMGLNLPN